MREKLDYINKDLAEDLKLDLYADHINFIDFHLPDEKMTNFFYFSSSNKDDLLEASSMKILYNLFQIVDVNLAYLVEPVAPKNKRSSSIERFYFILKKNENKLKKV